MCRWDAVQVADRLARPTPLGRETTHGNDINDPLLRSTGGLARPCIRSIGRNGRDRSGRPTRLSRSKLLKILPIEYLPRWHRMFPMPLSSREPPGARESPSRWFGIRSFAVRLGDLAICITLLVRQRSSVRPCENAIRSFAAPALDGGGRPRVDLAEGRRGEATLSGTYDDGRREIGIRSLVCWRG